MERATIISGGDFIEPESLPIGEPAKKRETAKTVKKPTKNLQKTLMEIEAEYMEEAYEQWGNVRDAAKSLGMNASTFVRKRKKYKEEREIL